MSILSVTDAMDDEHLKGFLETSTEDINEIDSVWGMNPLHSAIERKKVTRVDLLLCAGANPNLPDDLDHLPLNYGGSYPLHYAVETGSIEIVRLLLKYGADPSLRNQDDELPIHIAKRLHNHEIIELLI